MSDLKTYLKEAKNAIKDKDYEAAMIHCKDALKIDRKSYQALVMFGRVCLELHRYGDSKKALLLATQVDPENLIAWQGLSSLLEKNQNCFEKEEEIAILKHLTEVTEEEEKLDRLFRRLANVYQRYDCPQDAVVVFESLLALLIEKQHIKAVHKSIMELLEGVKDLSNDLLEKLIGSYEHIVDDSEIGENEGNYQKYLRLLYRTKDYRRMITAAQKMAKVFPTAYPLEWIARIYVESSNYSSEISEDCSLIPEEVLLKYIERLLHLYKDSPWGNLAEGLILLSRGSLQDAKSYLKKGCEALCKDVSAWLLLLEVQKDSGDFVGVDTSCRKINFLLDTSDSLIIPDRFPDENALRQEVLLTKVEALFQIGHPNQLKEAISLLDSVANKSLDICILSIKAQVKLGLITEASQELESIREEYEGSLGIQKITAFIASAKDDDETARSIYEDILKEDGENADVLFELGRIHFNQKEYKKALIYLLKSAKHNPKLGFPFIYIGHYYRLEDNMEKARKCYEKALALMPGSEDAGSSLSDLYRNNGQDDANFALLLRVTSEGSTGWAWLHLGLHYLSVRNYNESITALQRAVEINPKNRICFECLGDAYLARGSYTAALKVFTKVTEMHPTDALYSRCQIARLNHLVGKHLVSIAEYEEVLKENLPDEVRIVALVGLAEVLLTRAKLYKQDQLLFNLKEDCMYAVKCLTRAASENSNNFTVWKLLGDACTLQAIMPPSLSRFQVPTRLLDTSASDLEGTTEISKEEVLLLGGRCYGVGLRVSSDNPTLWHDLGVNIFLQGFIKLKLNRESKISPDEVAEGGEIISNYIVRSLSAVKKSLGFEASNHNVWNSLGVMSYFNGDFALAQHSFIRSLQLHPTVDAWTHLGALYLTQHDIYLAHEAFSEAQALDPGYVACWVGQAMVATSVGHYEAFDLYRHTTLLGIHPESCIGFASNVLRIACDRSEATKDVEHHIPSVGDSLSFYTREKEEDIVAQNMLGLSLEMMGLNHSASEAFYKAIKIAYNHDDFDQNILDGILSNYSRVLLSMDRISEAIAIYGKIKEPDFYSQCGLALSHLKVSNFDEAYQKYTDAFEWFAPDGTHKSHVMVALAFLQYKFKNIEEVKTLLFQSSSIQGLLALASLGILQKEPTLTEAALVELEPYTDSKDHAYNVAFLKSMQALLRSNYQEAKMILSRAVHRHPNISSLWRALSRLLMASKAESLDRLMEGANKAASAARALAQAAGDNANVVQDVVLKVMVHLKALMNPPSPPPVEKGKKKKKGTPPAPPTNVVSTEMRRNLSLKEAQRAVLMCPSKPETWAVLIASMNSKPKAVELAKKWSKETNTALKTWFIEACS